MQLTKLSTIFRIYDSEEDAIVSFLKEPAGSIKEAVPAGPLVLFLDQSADLCAFVRKLLNGYGYEVVSTLPPARRQAVAGRGDVSYLVLGPDCCQLPCEEAVAELKPLAKNAKLVQLDRGFHMDDAENAAAELLQKIGQKA